MATANGCQRTILAFAHAGERASLRTNADANTQHYLTHSTLFAERVQMGGTFSIRCRALTSSTFVLLLPLWPFSVFCRKRKHRRKKGLVHSVRTVCARDGRVCANWMPAGYAGCTKKWNRHRFAGWICARMRIPNPSSFC